MLQITKFIYQFCSCQTLYLTLIFEKILKTYDAMRTKFRAHQTTYLQLSGDYYFQSDYYLFIKVHSMFHDNVINLILNLFNMK